MSTLVGGATVRILRHRRDRVNFTSSNDIGNLTQGQSVCRGAHLENVRDILEGKPTAFFLKVHCEGMINCYRMNTLYAYIRLGKQ